MGQVLGNQLNQSYTGKGIPGPGCNGPNETEANNNQLSKGTPIRVNIKPYSPTNCNHDNAGIIFPSVKQTGPDVILGGNYEYTIGTNSPSGLLQLMQDKINLWENSPTYEA